MAPVLGSITTAMPERARVDSTASFNAVSVMNCTAWSRVRIRFWPLPSVSAGGSDWNPFPRASRSTLTLVSVPRRWLS